MSDLAPALVDPLQGMPGLDPEKVRNASVLLAGAGNIGSPLASLMARAGVRLLRIVDRDSVEVKNLRNQAFHPADVGRPKAEALAEQIQGQFPGITVEARTADLEHLPLDQFHVDVVLGALDSRRARQALVSEIAWPLGVPVVDGGVGEGLVGRVQVFVPGPAAACLECCWGNEDYRRLAEEYPCTANDTAGAPATVAPAFTGTVVAGLMAAEAVRILGGQAPAESQEIAFDLVHRRFLVSRLRRAPRCRFDHAVIREFIRPAHPHAAATVGDLLETVERRFGAAAVHLELRRGLAGGNGFGAERFVTPEHLRPRAGEPAAALGLLPGDRIRVRSGAESVFLAVDE
jgi:adenylyltransferase/sulfurtransferase